MRKREKLANQVTQGEEDLLELATAVTESLPARPVADRKVQQIASAAVGTVSALSSSGDPLVEFDGSPGPIPARSTVPLAPTDVGRGAVLLFDGGNPCKPILVGLLGKGRPAGEQAIEVDADGERVVITARKEMVLRVGKASIVLTRSGKVMVQGEHILTRSSGVNRIQGGSVQIN